MKPAFIWEHKEEHRLKKNPCRILGRVEVRTREHLWKARSGETNYRSECQPCLPTKDLCKEKLDNGDYVDMINRYCNWPPIMGRRWVLPIDLPLMVHCNYSTDGVWIISWIAKNWRQIDRGRSAVLGTAPWRCPARPPCLSRWSPCEEPPRAFAIIVSGNGAHRWRRRCGIGHVTR